MLYNFKHNNSVKENQEKNKGELGMNGLLRSNELSKPFADFLIKKESELNKEGRTMFGTDKDDQNNIINQKSEKNSDSIDQNQYNFVPENNKDFDRAYKKLEMKEEGFVRTAKIGKYTPMVDEIRDTIIDNNLTLNETRLLLYIHKNTVSFRKTHFKTTREKIQKDLNIVQPKVSIAIRNLLKNNYILEVKNKEERGTYYYALNPKTFNGVIVLRSLEEAPYKLDREEKGYTKMVLGDYTKKVSVLYQKGMSFIPKGYTETMGLTEIIDDFRLLQYILLQYILLHSICDAKVVELKMMTEEVKNPKKTVKNLIWLLLKNPNHVKFIIQQIFEVNEHKIGFNKRALITHPIDYICANWEKRLKPHWQNTKEFIDDSEESVTFRKKLKDLFMEYISMTEPMAKIIEFKPKSIGKS